MGNEMYEAKNQLQRQFFDPLVNLIGESQFESVECAFQQEQINVELTTEYKFQ